MGDEVVGRALTDEIDRRRELGEVHAGGRKPVLVDVRLGEEDAGGDVGGARVQTDAFDVGDGDRRSGVRPTLRIKRRVEALLDRPADLDQLARAGVYESGAELASRNGCRCCGRGDGDGDGEGGGRGDEDGPAEGAAAPTGDALAHGEPLLGVPKAARLTLR